jgi:hypothetical protein
MDFPFLVTRGLKFEVQQVIVAVSVAHILSEEYLKPGQHRPSSAVMLDEAIMRVEAGATIRQTNAPGRFR